MNNNQRGIGLVQLVWVIAGLLVIAGAGWHLVDHMRNSSVKFTTPYQAVLLTNGQVYFGKLEGLGTPFPVLREVFYVQNGQDPQTKAVASVLIKRGKEWHAPDRMILNTSMIVLVEPVNPSSRVAQLISEAH